MISLRRPVIRALCATCALLACGALAWLLTRSDVARAANADQLQQQINSGQNQVQNLQGAVNDASGRLSQLNSSIASLQARIARIQADLNAKRAQLLKLRTELNAAKTRLAQLEAFQTRAEGALSQQLVSGYESDRPDLVSVVLEAKGFSDLLERLQFAQRIRKQDVQVVGQVRAARKATAAEATKLGALEARQQAITSQVLAQRDSLGSTKLSLVRQQISVEQIKAGKQNQLDNAKGHLSDLQGQLQKLQAQQAAATNPAVGPVGVSSHGGFTFPMPKGAASPPGTWTLDNGVDIAAPGNTPLLAVCSGTIVLHGIGGFGPSAPILHCDSGQYVYYGHAGPGNAQAVGTHVGAGQVISEVGAGIVGISTGPHLEIGFADGSGSLLGPGTAPQMMSLLQGSYGG
jgi:murein DD-endopeptidase MepM/ murein hydrolase activator NlpD